jgi:surfeit locus 1 family protein
VDLDRLAGQLPYPLYPVYLRLQSQQPANAGDLPRPVHIPAPSDGPHMEYAIQWFLFAATALVIYLGLIRRDIKRRKAVGADPEEDEIDPVPVA